MTINLKEKINLLYEFLYNNNLKNCFNVKKIIVDKIVKDDVIISSSELSTKLVKQLLLQNIQFSENINNSLIFKGFNDNYSIIIKISFNENENYNDCLLSYILSQLVLNNITKHILLPIINFETKKENIELILKLTDKIINKSSKKCFISIRENYFDSFSLEKYFSYKKNIDWSIILFIMIHTLLIIRLNFPKFKHNMLTLNSIFIHENESINNIYDYKDTNFILPNFNYNIKIGNFEKSTISNDENNNELNDIAFFAEDIIKFTKKSNNINLDNKSLDFLKKIIKLNKEKNSLLENLLFDNYFKNFIQDTNMIGSYKSIRKINNNYKMTLHNNYENVLGDQHNIFNNFTRKIRNDENALSEQHNTKFTRKINNNENNYKIDGGSVGTVTTATKNEKNTPFMSNDEKNTMKKKSMDQPTVKEPPLILEQKIYDVNKQIQPKQQPPPAYIPVYNQIGDVVKNIDNPTYVQPFQKQYNITLGNPLGNYKLLNTVFEDVLPGDPSTLSFNTTYERYDLIKWMRSLLIQTIDGEPMDVKGGQNSILSFIKIINYNPYDIKTFGNNFLLYNGAYPIRFRDEKLQIAKPSNGVNIRIYNLTLGEMRAETINKQINKYDFDIWREMWFYTYVRNELIKKKISPNFVSSILYKIDKKININWKEFNIVYQKYNDEINKKHNLEGNIYNSLKPNINNINIIINIISLNKLLYNKILKEFYSELNIEVKYYEPFKIPSVLSSIKNLNINPHINNIVIEYEDNGDKKYIHYKRSSIDELKKIVFLNILNRNKLDLNTTSGNNLILVTEAPTTTLIKWATPVYENYGSLKKMISTGYHSINVWKSIIFQILYIFYVLYEKEIYFEELSLEKNFFIKDLQYDSNNVKYWVYTIDKINYYVPNYGYLVLFDSTYSNINTMENDFKYKLLSSEFDKNNNEDIKQNILLKFDSIVNTSNFCSKIKMNFGLMPCEEICKLLDSINNTKFNKSFEVYFSDNFSCFFNNRIGNILMKTEKEIINKLNRPNFEKGQLFIYEKRYDEFYWVMYDSDDATNPRQKHIWVKENNVYIKTLINIYNLYSYPEVVLPDKINEENIIERYSLL